jgi:hypothetical protein
VLTSGPILRSYPVADKVQAVAYNTSEDDEAYDESRWRCIICGSADQEDVLLLCDNCNDAYHNHCLDIDGIPQGDWFCPNCVTFTDIDFARNFPAPARRARTAIQAADRSTSPSRWGGRQSRRRQLQQQQQWDRAWARMRDRAWEHLNADLREDEAMGGYVALTQRQHEERIRWMNRLSRSNNSSAAYLRATRSESGQSNRADTPPAPMSDPEEDRAWSMFDAAKSSAERGAKRARRTSSREDSPSGSRNATPRTPRTPVRSPPTQTRQLKRPRTRRVTPPLKPQTDNTADAASVTPGVTTNRRTSGVTGDSGGTFLQGLLSNINRSKSPQTPLDGSIVLTPAARALLFGPSPPHSPPLPPTNIGSVDSFPSLTELLPSSPEPPKRQRSSSPSFAIKSHIQQLVSQELKPHYRSGQLSRDEFTEINKKICRKLYELVEQGEEVEGLISDEVEREVDALKRPQSDLLVLS